MEIIGKRFAVCADCQEVAWCDVHELIEFKEQHKGHNMTAAIVTPLTSTNSFRNAWSAMLRWQPKIRQLEGGDERDNK